VYAFGYKSLSSRQEFAPSGKTIAGSETNAMNELSNWNANFHPFVPGTEEDATSTSREPDLEELLYLCLESGLDECFWEEFIRRTQPLIAGVVAKSIRRWVRPAPTLVDDLVQDTYLKLCGQDFKALREFKWTHENSLCAFLKVVAARVVLDHFRNSYSLKRGRGRTEESLDHVLASDWGASSNDADRNVLLEQINDCLESRASDPTFLRDYTIFWLYYRDGWTAKDIADLPSVGLTVKGVESTLLRVTRRVRAQLMRETCGVVNN
jgi:RNA polymerase sigma-70 factor (ECF subfamily)